MSKSSREPSAWQRILRRHWVWAAVVLIVLFAAGVRLRLREMPLERDEGEYAYAGQLLLQGVPPYKLAYNMKLPGTYMAYAVMLAIFGQTPSGVHIGLMLINAASIVLVFLLGRKLLDEIAGVTAAGLFALMSLSPSVLGLAAHATHFVVLPALAGTLILLTCIKPPRALWLLVSGLLFGVALLMKQHGVLFALCGGIYLGWVMLRRKPFRWKAPATALGLFGAGVIVPYVGMIGLLAAMGVFDEFIFWTVTYARQYVSIVPAGEAPALLRYSLHGLWSDNPYFWILAAISVVVMWWEDRVEGWRFFLMAFLLCSIAAVSAGFYFREHYFVLLLPALALLSGIGISRSIYLLKHDRTIELFVAVAMLLLLLVGVGNSIVSFGTLWFGLSPANATERVYMTTLFSEARKAGDYIKSKTATDARVAVVGSEPEIYFYSQRRSATGYIYAYPLVETHGYALQMQEKMIQEIEQANPEYIVFVNDDMSWLTRDSSPRRIFQWWENYWVTRYDIEQTLNVSATFGEQDVPGEARTLKNAQGPGYLLVLKRKNLPSPQSARKRIEREATDVTEKKSL